MSDVPKVRDSIYIPLKNRDTRYGLWHVRYPVTIPFIQMLSIEDIEEGLPTAGDEQNDHAARWEPRRLQLPIVDMATYWHRGANVRLVNVADSEPIYRAITAHLYAWKNALENTYNPVRAPLEDLAILDQFASQVYEHAKFVFDPSSAVGLLSLRRGRISRRSNAEHMARVRLEADKRKQEILTSNIHFHPSTGGKPVDPNTIDWGGQARIDDKPPREKLADVFTKL